ncbi:MULTISPECIES: trypsin-like peptidase domain-containing protein [unclassified Caballeronia]|uniref:trypsin-like peptidase domain-containing protein n=1 Tax=unclassified Caballeronia TaxID=2646786 RepID=UPI002858234B|nr:MULTISPECIES: trypsin-like peptidase domain-containing protein [unclassified Caballeronia]MDR5753015.1 trypsin-like peptidase domain-containing protein [Caballeronia sp. LZ024]MDR5845087.1 trypsin-like peptidase domain-containing protein [Caballeronia sp. LZ031]
MPATEGDAFSYIDIAIMKVDPEKIMPVEVAGNSDFEKVATLQSVCIVGFPGPPYERTGIVDGVDWEWVDQHLFGQAYGFKRVAPGVVHRSSGTIGGDEIGWVFGHDATTLGGNSGSGVFAWHDGGGAFGLHFAGNSLDTNCAHGFSSPLARTLLRALGILCEGRAGPRGNEVDEA